MYISNKDVKEALDALQLCAGQTAGAERFIHTKQYVNQQDKTEAILLVDPKIRLIASIEK